MKIFLVSRGWPTPDNPQWGCFEKDQAIALRKVGHEVIVMNVDQRVRLSWRKPGITHRKIDGFDCYTFYILPAIITQKISFDLWYRISQKQMLYLFEYLLKKYGKPDIIYAHYFKNIISCKSIQDKYKIPLTGMEHWSVMAYPIIPNHYLKLGYIGYKNVDLLITVSNALHNNIKRIFGKDSIIIHNTIGQEFIDSGIPTDKALEKFTFISIGNLFPIKGFDILIKAFYKSNLYTEGVKLIIVGAGTIQNELENLIKELNLRDSVVLKGRKNKTEIIALLKESNAFVLSSRSETFGVVFIEAMSQGLPVIGTKCGGPEEIITESNGLIVAVDNIDELANAMSMMYKNANKYNNNLIRENVLVNYSPNAIGLKLTEEFEKLIDR